MCATSGGNKSVLEILMNRGARLDVLNCGEFSLLDVATACQRSEIIEYLKAHGEIKRTKEGNNNKFYI